MLPNPLSQAHHEDLAGTPGSTKYRDHRLLALYFDMTAMPLADQIRALEAAQKFISTQMTPADLVAIMLFTAAPVASYRISPDDQRPALDHHRHARRRRRGFRRDCRGRGRRRYRRGFRTGRQRIQHLQHRPPAFRAADCRAMLGQLSEKKQLLYFASGISSTASTTRRSCTRPSTPPSAPVFPSGPSMRADW